LTRGETKARTRARLLNAAQEVFAERGFFAASVEEVAERAGFSMGAVYSNFDTKADLFLALFEEHIARQVQEYLALLASAETVEEQARAAADHWMRYVREHPEYFPLFLEFAAYAAREPRLLASLATRLRALHEAFTRMVAGGAAEHGIDLRPETAAQLGVVVTALANGLALAKLADPEAVPDELFGSFLAVFFGAVISRNQSSKDVEVD
jgi:AcrR family transcriptional regulator